MCFDAEIGVHTLPTVLATANVTSSPAASAPEDPAAAAAAPPECTKHNVTSRCALFIPARAPAASLMESGRSFRCSSCALASGFAASLSASFRHVFRMITAPTIRSKHTTAPPTPPAMALTLLELSFAEYVTHVGSWLQGCCVTGAGPGHAVPVGSNEPADDRQAAERIRVGVGPPETAHVAEQALHSPNWYE